VEWGTHLCHFYESKSDLLDFLISYFQAGLEQHEKCICTVFDPVNEQDLRAVIASAHPDWERRLATGDLEIIGSVQHGTAPAVDPGDLVAGWEAKLVGALADGHTGLRVNEYPMALSNGDDQLLNAYEKAFAGFLADRPALVLSCYPMPVEATDPALEIGFCDQEAWTERDRQWSTVVRSELRELRAAVKQLTQERSVRAAERAREVAAFGARLSQEITSRLAAEMALQESEERFRLYFGLNLVGLAMLKLHPKRIEVNDRLCKILGYTGDELGRIDWTQITHPEDWATDRKAYAQILAGAVSDVSQPKRWIRKDGQVVHTNVLIRCRRGEDGSLEYVAAMVKEITSPDEISARNLKTRKSSHPKHPKLSARELDVAKRIGAGHTVKEIAAELTLSEKTVSTYRTRILGKLELKTTAELIRFSLQHYLPR
jgi:PAS domain S-box-containing protein